MTALQQVMNDIEKHYPNLFDLQTAQGREFISRFYKYLEMEKEQIKKAYNIGLITDFEYDWHEMKVKTFEQYYNETFSNKGD